MPEPGVMLATLIDAPFDDPDWVFETKWDGVRAICRVDEHRRLRLLSRTGHDLSGIFPELTAIARAVAGVPVTLDGEVIALDAQGRSSFQALQPLLNRRRPPPEADRVPVRYVAFDILEHRGRDLTGLPLEERMRILRAALPEIPGVATISTAVREGGKAAFAAAARAGLEGIVGKRLASRYARGRSRDWVKIKARRQQEFVVGGWTEPRGSRSRFGSLLLGFYEDGVLRYAGSVGTGFDERALEDVSARLHTIGRASSPFAPPPSRLASAVHWVEPRLVAEVKFAEWTRGGRVRQPVFQGLRDDKPPREVVREVAASAGG